MADNDCCTIAEIGVGWPESQEVKILAKWKRYSDAYTDVGSAIVVTETLDAVAK